MHTFSPLIKAWKQKGITKINKILKEKIESSFTFGTFKLFLQQKKFAHLQIGPQMAHNIDYKKNRLYWQKMGFLRNTQDLLYQKKSKCISSPEQNYFTHFAMRYPVSFVFLSLIIGKLGLRLFRQNCFKITFEIGPVHHFRMIHTRFISKFPSFIGDKIYQKILVLMFVNQLC